MSIERQIRYFEMQRERNPRGSFWLPLADLHLRHGDAARALDVLGEGLGDRRPGVSARWLLARIHAELGDVDRARAELKDLLADDPGHRLAADFATSLDAKPATVEPASDEPAPDEPTEDVVEHVEDRPAEEPVAESVTPEPEVADDASVEPEPVVEETPPAPAPEDPPRGSFVTRTLADIYLAQGHRGRALEILHRILDEHPDREDVATLIASLEAEDGEAAPEPVAVEDRDQENRTRFEAWERREREAGGE